MPTRRIGSIVPTIVGGLRFRQYTVFSIIARTALQGVQPDLVFGLKISCKRDKSEDLWLDGRIRAEEICDHLGGSHRTMSLCKEKCRVGGESIPPISLVEKLDKNKPKGENANLMRDLAVRHVALRGKVEIAPFTDSEFELCLFYGKHTLASRFHESMFYLFLL